jgi:glycosyltransferase involved in cell wall biosynthesis
MRLGSQAPREKGQTHNWVLYDYLQVNGGAERLAITLANSLPGFSLGVSGIYEAFAETGDLNGVVPVVPGAPVCWLPRIPRALVTFSLGYLAIEHANCVIYSGAYAPLAVKRQARGKRIYYCHTPPRFAFDRQDEYLQRAPALFRPALRLAIWRYRRAYLKSLRVMDVVLVNSHHVRDRLARETGIEAQVVYPPIDLAGFRFLGQEDYYLSVGRLEPNKRIDLIIGAFRAMPDKKLLVASGGSEFARLKALAAGAPNIAVLGWQSQAGMARLIGNAIAVIYIPSDEDFGMSAVEAMAAGKPVIGVDEGGLRESIIDGKTGIMLHSGPDIPALCAAITELTAEAAANMRLACESRAREFSVERFMSAFRALIA